MRHTPRFFAEAAGIRHTSPTFVEELKKDLEEYRDLLETLPGEAVSVVQGQAQELRRILKLIEDAERINGR